MGRWNHFLEDDRIDEKVTKKEKEKALKNDNIIIGCEFEFKVHEELTGSEGLRELYDNAIYEIESYNEAVDEYESELEDYEDETKRLKDKVFDIEDKISELDDAIESADESIEEFGDEIEALESDIEDLEEEINNEDDPEERDNLEHDNRLKIESLQSEIKQLAARRTKTEENKERWDDEKIDLEAEKEDIEDDIKYREQDGKWENTSPPFLDSYLAPNYFDYMQNWFGYSNSQLEAEPGERVEEPPEFHTEGNYEGFEDAIESNGYLDDAPFGGHYEIGNYGTVSQPIGSRTWAVEPDSSLGDEGIEVKSPPMELPKFIDDYFDDMFKWIEDIGYTDSDCGFHCHMSIPNSSNELDVLKLILFTEEEWIYQAFEERANNYFTKSIKKKMKSDTTLTKKDLQELFNRKKLAMKFELISSGYDSIKVLDRQTGHVEFRYMGGTRYTQKPKDVKSVIANYAYWLSMAMDPEFKRKEYIHKLQRVFNKMEMFFLEHKEDVIIWWLQKMDGREHLNQQDTDYMMAELKRTKKALITLNTKYKIDSETERLLLQNRNFITGMYREIFFGLKKNLSKSSMAVYKQGHPRGSMIV